jgi:hypothetical protein
MDMELTKIHITQDLLRQAEEHDGNASNNRLWAKGADDAEQARMFEENVEHFVMMAEMYRNMAKHPDTIIKLFMED